MNLQETLKSKIKSCISEQFMTYFYLISILYHVYDVVSYSKRMEGAGHAHREGKCAGLSLRITNHEGPKRFLC